LACEFGTATAELATTAGVCAATSAQSRLAAISSVAKDPADRRIDVKVVVNISFLPEN
jgi:hypothetical protein